MDLIDTHAHLYLDHFDTDRNEVVKRAIDNKVTKMLLPNIDEQSLQPMIRLCQDFPGYCYPMLGLHPTDVKENYEEVLKSLFMNLEKYDFVAIGEIGIDLYWDATFEKEQEAALRFQVEQAVSHHLPVVIHTRESMQKTIDLMADYKGAVKGVFHCFNGTLKQARAIIDMGFFLGVGGVVTFKNAKVDEVIKEIDPEYLVLETDAPFLAPVPKRGKRNESVFLPYIANKIADLHQVSSEEIAKQTSLNAKALFHRICK